MTIAQWKVELVRQELVTFMDEKHPTQSQSPELQRFLDLLRANKTRVRIRGDGGIGIYLAYHEEKEAPFECRVNGGIRFLRLREFTLLPSVFL